MADENGLRRRAAARTYPSGAVLETAMAAPRDVPTYEEDFVAWLEDQAQHARRGEIDALDLENIAEELEGMARSDRREIRNRLTVLLTHLLKYMTSREGGRPAGSVRSVSNESGSNPSSRTVRA
jgi:hypothetical protein